MPQQKSLRLAMSAGFPSLSGTNNLKNGERNKRVETLGPNSRRRTRKRFPAMSGVQQAKANQVGNDDRKDNGGLVYESDPPKSTKLSYFF